VHLLQLCVSICTCTSLHLDLHSFPTRRSSDLLAGSRTRSRRAIQQHAPSRRAIQRHLDGQAAARRRYAASRARPLSIHRGAAAADRKSTRLNSSHVKISYAVFCLKKKKYKEIK